MSRDVTDIQRGPSRFWPVRRSGVIFHRFVLRGKGPFWLFGRPQPLKKPKKSKGSFFEQNIPLKWYHFERLGKSASGAVNGFDRRWHCRGAGSFATAQIYLAATALMYLASSDTQILPPVFYPFVWCLGFSKQCMDLRVGTNASGLLTLIQGQSLQCIPQLPFLLHASYLLLCWWWWWTSIGAAAAAVLNDERLATKLSALKLISAMPFTFALSESKKHKSP